MTEVVRTRAQVYELLTPQVRRLPRYPHESGGLWSADADVSDGLGTVGVEVRGHIEKRDGQTLRRELCWQLTRDAEHWPALVLTFVCTERRDGIDLAATFGPQPEPEVTLVHASQACAVIEQLIGATTSVGSGCATSHARLWTTAGQREVLVSAPELYGTGLAASLYRPRAISRARTTSVQVARKLRAATTLGPTPGPPPKYFRHGFGRW